MTYNDIVRAIAQGALNITAGITTIVPDSRVHRAMVAFCRLESAAPYLLAACKAALARWKYESVGEIKMLADAVAKAEGKETE